MNEREHQDHMSRALELAGRASFTSPNPKVGCLLVRDGEVLGEGHHGGAGTSHAEIRALRAAGDATGATAYVTLEPCTHQGRTPPCVPALIAAGIGRVVVATEDPDPRVAGSGLRRLAEAGIEVVSGVLEKEARALNRTYIHHRLTARPFVTLKLALSLDGRMAAPDGSARWISGADARAEGHRGRMAADAVVIGSGTALADDPALTVRDVQAVRQPARVLVDSTGRTPAGARLFDPGEVVVVTTNSASHETQTAYKETGAEVLVLPRTNEGVDLPAMLDALGQRGWLELYVEGGARLATSFLQADLVDRLDVHHGPVVLGRGGPEIGSLEVTTMADAPRWRLLRVAAAGDDVLMSYERER
ncbi:MAG: bifunctional diaminohydroxyphosphoribosylaminopyrimidine deaminase/5-amino-6-(5-phosphoribosylamino)uracil reductase RibD [Actinomycetota bacterium]